MSVLHHESSKMWIRARAGRPWLAASFVLAAGLAIGCEEDYDDDEVTMAPDAAHVDTAASEPGELTAEESAEAARRASSAEFVEAAQEVRRSAREASEQDV